MGIIGLIVDMAEDDTVMEGARKDILENVAMVGRLEIWVDDSGVLLAGGWERLVISSVSLSSWSLLAGGWKGGGRQWWLGRHFTWKSP